MYSASDARLAAFLKRLEHYVNLNTPSGYAEGLNAMAAQLKADFEQAGCQVLLHRRDGGNLLQCHVGAGAKQILLLGHIDTVFERDTASKRPFRQEGTKLYGPGVLDMKSGVLMILEIMRHFASCLPKEYRLCALINCDEEIGSKESRELIMELGKQSIACLCMEPSKPEYCTVARKGLITFRIHTHGMAAHSGVNYLLGHSAIQGLCNIIGKLYTLRDDEGGISVNIGGISGGTSKGNIVADSAGLIGEIRFYEPAQIDALLGILTQYAAETGVENVSSDLEILTLRPPMKQTDASRRLYELAHAAAVRHGLILQPRTHGGCSDGSFVASVGTPVIDGMGAEGEFSHTAEEYVRADTLINRLDMCIDLIETLTKEERP